MGLDEHQGIYFEPMKKHRPLFTRREMLKVGAIGGLTLSQYLRAQAASGKKSSRRSAIFIFLEGGLDGLGILQMFHGPCLFRG